MTNKLLPAKIILVLVIMLCLGVVMGVTGYALTLKKNPLMAVRQTTKPTIVPTTTPTSEPIATPIASPEPVAVKTSAEFNKAMTLVPEDWGKVAKVDNYFDYSNQNKISNIYTIDFTNNVKGVYQEGVNLIAYNKIKEQGKCIDYYNKNFDTPNALRYYADDQICYITENGIYNLNTKKSAILPQNFPFDTGTKVQTSLFYFFDDTGKKIIGIFSPQGKYFIQSVDIYEGCGIDFIDTTAGQRKGSTNSVFSCDPLVNFSEDEKTFTVRANYVGMASPKTQFSIIQGNKQWEILPKIISKEIDPEEEFRGEEINPVRDFKVMSITDSEVRFGILKDTEYYSKGSYTFTLSTDKITKQ